MPAPAGPNGHPKTRNCLTIGGGAFIPWVDGDQKQTSFFHESDHRDRGYTAPSANCGRSRLHGSSLPAGSGRSWSPFRGTVAGASSCPDASSCHDTRRILRNIGGSCYPGLRAMGVATRLNTPGILRHCAQAHSCRGIGLGPSTPYALPARGNHLIKNV